MWEPPGGLYTPAPEASWATLKDRMTEREITAWAVFGDAMGVPASAGPHWYLGVLATEPARQGTGLGRHPGVPGDGDAGQPRYLPPARVRGGA